MKQLILLLSILCLCIGGVNAATVSHSANQVKPGTFQPGDYNFPGKLGIGTTSPNEKLHVNGTIISRDTDTAVEMTGATTHGFVRFTETDGSTVKWEMRKTPAALEFNEGANTNNRLYIQNDGKVGIGTINPQANLDLEGVFRMSGNDFLVDNSEKLNMRRNADYDNGWKYIQNGSAELMQMRDGGFEFQVSTSGTAGDPITWEETLTLEDDGDILMGYGDVGIRTSNPSYALQVGESGDGTQARANAWNTFSDERWKTNLTQIECAIDKVDNISGYYFYWKNGTDKSKQVGVSAQEVEKVLPEIVSEDGEGYKSVDYSKLSALLIETVKEQKEQIKKLKEQNEKLHKETEQMREAICKISPKESFC